MRESHRNKDFFDGENRLNVILTQQLYKRHFAPRPSSSGLLFCNTGLLLVLLWLLSQISISDSGELARRCRLFLLLALVIMHKGIQRSDNPPGFVRDIRQAQAHLHTAQGAG